MNDLTTLEHALIVDENGQHIYQFQQFDGDSLCSISEIPIDPEYYKLFNEAFLTAGKARTDITEFIIECLTCNY